MASLVLLAPFSAFAAFATFVFLPALASFIPQVRVKFEAAASTMTCALAVAALVDGGLVNTARHTISTKRRTRAKLKTFTICFAALGGEPPHPVMRRKVSGSVRILSSTDSFRWGFISDRWRLIDDAFRGDR